MFSLLHNQLIYPSLSLSLFLLGLLLGICTPRIPEIGKSVTAGVRPLISETHSEDELFICLWSGAQICTETP